MIKKIFITLIDKYQSGTATASEQQLVEAYLDKLEAGDNAVAVAEDAVKDEVWERIRAEMRQEEDPVQQMAWHSKRWVRMLAAACVVGAMGVTILLVSKKPVPEVAEHSSKKEIVPSYVRHIANTSGKNMVIHLPDSSLVILGGKSELTYTEPFIDERALSLTGKAEFNVKTDKAKPFTVLSGVISTVVLGTRFTVTAYANATQIRVRLYEGKVVVKPIDKQDKKMPKDFGLMPGQEFIYSNNAMAMVRRFATIGAETNAHADESMGEATVLPEKLNGSWNMFNNQPLGLVFDQLAELYGVTIVYNKQDVRRKYFVGRFNKSDSLDIILKYITTANRLSVSKENNIYYINK